MKEYDEQCINIAEAALHRIAQQFPTLRMERIADEPVEIYISLPIQLGLKHRVDLILQNRDELHFSAGNFHIEWAPCTDHSMVEAFIEVATGFLEGRYRVMEHYQGDRYVKGELQIRINGKQWETIGISKTLIPPGIGKKHVRELVNAE
jgi:hypothetical protein